LPAFLLDLTRRDRAELLLHQATLVPIGSPLSIPEREDIMES
jgi:hypothetical protein